MKNDLKAGVRHLYDSKEVSFARLLTLARRVEDEEVATKTHVKGATMTDSQQGQTQTQPNPLQQLQGQVQELMAVVKAGQVPQHRGRGGPSKGGSNGNSNNNGSRGPSRDSSRGSNGTGRDIRQNLKGPEPSSAGPFNPNQRPLQCFKCKGWGHPRRICPSRLNYSRGGSMREGPSPDPNPETGSQPQPPNQD